MPLDAIDRKRLTAAGLDIVHPFDASRYNEAVRGRGRLAPLPLFGRLQAYALIVGNTRALWPPFVEAVRSSEELRRTPHPLDRYVEDTIRASLAGSTYAWEARFSHEGGARLVSMLHAAEASGLASVGPAYLAAHPEHGPWIGLRAVVVFDAPPPPPPRQRPRLPCVGCAGPCKEALERTANKDGATWRDWVALREACPVGKGSRYGEAQLRYHYVKDPAVFDGEPGDGAGA